MGCTVCTKDEKPMKFLWKDKEFYMKHRNDKEAVPLGLLEVTIPAGISDFDVCFECCEVVGAAKDQDKYELLVNDLLRIIMKRFKKWRKCFVKL